MGRNSYFVVGGELKHMERVQMEAVKPKQETVPVKLFALHCLLCVNGARPFT